MGTYILTEKIEKILRSRGYNLVCKYCDCPILVGDEVESKQQRRGKSKLYHKKCYEDSHYDVKDDATDEELKNYFQRPKISVRSFGKEVVAYHYEYPSLKSRILSIMDRSDERKVFQIELARSQRIEDSDFYDVFSMIVWQKEKSKRREVWIVKELVEEHVNV